MINKKREKKHKEWSRKKLKIQQNEPHNKPGSYEKEISSCFTSNPRRVTFNRHEHHNRRHGHCVKMLDLSSSLHMELHTLHTHFINQYIYRYRATHYMLYMYVHLNRVTIEHSFA